ncbi:hypothetical protein ACXLPV_004818 [Vibrio parahaemolyticus]
MNKNIKDNLKVWHQLYLQQNAEVDPDDPSIWDYDNADKYIPFFEYQLLGALTFLKEAFHDTEDLELLGLISKLEMQIHRDMAEEQQYENEHHELELEAMRYSDSVRKYCIDLFYNEKRYQLDFSQFRSEVKQNKGLLSEAGLYEQLIRYLDENKKLDAIYNEVKYAALKVDHEGDLPSIEQIDELFAQYKDKIDNNAKKHIAKQLKKARN